MPFGSSMKEAPVANTGSGEKVTWEYQWLDPQVGARSIYRTGRRTFRILPEVDEDGNLVPGEDGRGVTAGEVRWAEFWIPVLDGDRQRQQRVMVDWRFPEMYRNPIWTRLYADMPKEKNGKPNPDRKNPKQRFAINVWDRTKVLFGPNGEIAYPNEQDKYFINDNGNVVELKGTPTPLNRVRIFESSAGKEGGKHVLQQVLDYATSVSHPTDPDEKKLYLHEFDLSVKITGVDQDTRRTIQLASNFTPVTEEMWSAPRYNLEEWAKPWPHDAIEALLDGEDFREVVEKYDIVQYPSLPKSEEEAEIPF